MFLCVREYLDSLGEKREKAIDSVANRQIMSHHMRDEEIVERAALYVFVLRALLVPLCVETFDNGQRDGGEANQRVGVVHELLDRENGERERSRRRDAHCA